MQISIEAIKNTVNDLSLNKTNASAPSTFAKVVCVPFAFGGVSGNVKLNKPNIPDATAAITNVCANCSVCSSKTLSIIQPTAIQPIVPKNLTEGNSLAGSFIWRKATEFAKANVGAYINEYNNTIQ